MQRRTPDPQNTFPDAPRRPALLAGVLTLVAVALATFLLARSPDVPATPGFAAAARDVADTSTTDRYVGVVGGAVDGGEVADAGPAPTSAATGDGVTPTVPETTRPSSTPAPATPTTAPRSSVASSPSGSAAVAPGAAATGGPVPGEDAYLACVRQRESGNGYRQVNPRSGASGAYQFLPDTWQSTARHAGRPDLATISPHAASAADQDAMARHLLRWQGRTPWAGWGC